MIGDRSSILYQPENRVGRYHRQGTHRLGIVYGRVVCISALTLEHDGRVKGVAVIPKGRSVVLKGHIVVLGLR